MGLDIYAYKVSKKVAEKYNISLESSCRDISDALDKEAKEEYKKITSRMLKKLRKDYEVNSPCEYSKTFSYFILDLQKKLKYYKEYSFNLKALGYDDWKKNFTAIKTPDEVSEVFNAHGEKMFAFYDAYFRKVNFIYRYFSEYLENESCAVSKSHIADLISICKDVLKHEGDEDYASENLPTTSGFFFGSTEYNEYYFEDVKDCLKQMTKLYKSMGDDDFVLWDFSW